MADTGRASPRNVLAIRTRVHSDPKRARCGLGEQRRGFPPGIVNESEWRTATFLEPVGQRLALQIEPVHPFGRCGIVLLSVSSADDGLAAHRA